MMALALLSMEWPAMMALGVSFFQWNGLEVRWAFFSTGMAWGCWLGVSFSQWNGLELRWAFLSMDPLRPLKAYDLTEQQDAAQSQNGLRSGPQWIHSPRAGLFLRKASQGKL